LVPELPDTVTWPHWCTCYLSRDYRKNSCSLS